MPSLSAALVPAAAPLSAETTLPGNVFSEPSLTTTLEARAPSPAGGWAPVRLAGGRGRCAGRVELLHQGVWGTVCDDLWGLQQAGVVCRRLGCGRAVLAPGEAHFGEGSGKILLDDVRCRGDEGGLEACAHRGWLSHNCGHGEDAGVVCSDAAHAAGTPPGRPPAASAGSAAAERPLCGGVIANASGAVRNPPRSSLRDNVTCVWEIRANASDHVLLAFPYLSLDCANEYFEILDGPPSSATSLGRTCSGFYLTYESSSSSMTLVYFRGSNSIGKVFIAYYYAAPKEPVPRTLQPTATPAATPATTTMTMATARPGDWLALRLAGGAGPCSGRVELLHEGAWGTVCDDLWDLTAAEVVCRQLGCGRAVAALGKAHFGPGSGHILLDNVRCSGAERHLGQCAHSGWAEHNCGHHEDAGVTCSDAEVLTPPTPPGLSTASRDPVTGGSGSCGGVLTRAPGSFSSPHYPENYPTDTQCVWEIRVEETSRVRLTIPSLSLEDIPGCPFDSVDVFDGPRNASLSLGRFCSPGPVLVFSSSHILTVVFQSDPVVTGPGFHALFDAVPPGKGEPGGSSSCGGVLSSPEGSFSSAPSPAGGPTGVRCVWEIRVAEGLLVLLTVRRLRLEGAFGCPDFIEVFDGRQRASLSMGQFCTGADLTFLASSNVLTLVFRSDAAGTSAGFSALYRAVPPDPGAGEGEPGVDGHPTAGPTDSTTVSPPTEEDVPCGGLLTNASGAFSSPGYPRAYPPNVVCVWDIQVEAGARVQLTLDVVQLEDAAGCPSDFLEVFDGPPSAGFSLGRLCSRPPATFTSSSRRLALVLHSDATTGSSAGFSASYTSLLPDADSEAALRLSGGSHRCEGRVELRLGGGGGWGTVCDDGWDLRDARVVCRQLGCGPALAAPGSAHFGPGRGPIALDDVGCRGSEAGLGGCPHGGWLSHNCGHGEDAGVVCTAPSPEPTETPTPTVSPAPGEQPRSPRPLDLPEVRLAAGRSRCEGRVEIRHGGAWGTVCDDLWALPAARVVCRQLGCGVALAAPRGGLFGPGSGPVLLDNVRCAGGESSLGRCRHLGLAVHNCGHQEDAGAICAASVSGITTPPAAMPTAPTAPPDASAGPDDRTPPPRTPPPDAPPSPAADLDGPSETTPASEEEPTPPGPPPDGAPPAAPRDHAQLSCLPHYFRVTVDRGYLRRLGYSSWDVHLNDELCRPHVVGRFLVFNIPYGHCGTVRQESLGSLSYSNAISGHVTVRHRVPQLKLTCSVDSPSAAASPGRGAAYEVSAAFLQLPMAPPLGSAGWEDAGQREEVLLQVTLHSPDPRLRLSVDTCVASPDPQDFATVKYDLIRQGCISDDASSSVSLPSPGRNTAQFKFNAFGFLPGYEVVYLRCEVAVCKAGDPSSRCSRGCARRRGRSRRGAGPVEEATAEQLAGRLQVLGPLEIRRGTDQGKGRRDVSRFPTSV